MKRLYVSIALISFFIIYPGIAFSQSSKSVVISLNKLESKTEIGISFQDYSRSLGDINYEVKTFLNSKESKTKPKLAESIQMVMTHYVNAKKVWEGESLDNQYFFGLPVRSEDNDGGIHYTSPEIDNNSFTAYLLKSYPEMAKTYEMNKDTKGILVGDVIRIIWKAASLELKKTNTILKN